jgi:hypothetical protein
LALSVRDTFEKSTAFTVFGVGPDRVMQLPKALGGDPTTWATLTSAVSSERDAWLDLLWAKAHFLMLPKPIIEFMKSAPWQRVSVNDQTVAGAAADATLDKYGTFRSTTMHLPGSYAYLPRLGYELARTTTAVSVGYDLIGRIYHEMTHAWLWLEELADADLQKLYVDGLAAYAHATDASGTVLDLELAFSEAAAYYVEDRIIRWCTALSELDRLRREAVTPVAAPPNQPSLRDRVDAIVAAYDKPRSLYGVVFQDGSMHTITSPAITPTLRAAIDKKLLDGRPLTKPFADTPLANLAIALAGL